MLLSLYNMSVGIRKSPLAGSVIVRASSKSPLYIAPVVIGESSVTTGERLYTFSSNVPVPVIETLSRAVTLILYTSLGRSVALLFMIPNV